MIWPSPDNSLKLGIDDNGDGTTIVMLQPFPLDRSVYQDQRALSDRHRFITLDTFGFGESELPEAGYSIEMMADAVAQLLDGLGIDKKIVLGGVSMGGYIALAFAKKYPERLKGLILADTRASADSDDAKQKRETMIELAKNEGSAAVIEKMLPNMVGKFSHENRPAVLQHIRELASKQRPEAVVAALAAMRDRPDMTATLSQIKVPTLVIVGKDDTLTPPSDAEAMAKAIPDCKLEVIQSAGHLSLLECPREFTTAIRMFVMSV